MLGFLVITSEGSDILVKDHIRWINILKDPLSIAMSNTLRHRNELKLFNRDFFWEVTMRICGNFKIEEGLRDCIRYISKYIPVDRIYLERYDGNLFAMRPIARASSDKAEVLDMLLPLPEDAKEAMKEVRRTWYDGSLPPVIVINDPDDEPVTKNLLDKLGEPLSSAMSMPLFIKDHIAGTVVVLAKGKDRYNEDHARLFATLKMPFYVAMANNLKHLEIIKLKDLLADDNRYLQSELRKVSGEKIIGADFGLKEVMYKVQQVAKMGSPVLLLGETGTGKDVIANAIHYSSLRRKESFISVNCGAIPETLIDSELFGHEKGAFTGALSQKRGRFERANRGTIFLDEIAELPLQAQVRLLRVLQSKEIERVGGNKTIKLDIRIIAATNRDMKQMVKDKLFREDLWFRLNVFPIIIPPLRERRSDIPALVQYFIHEKTKELKLPKIPKLDRNAIDMLLSYNWPGNVRELENIIERVLILNPNGPLTFDHMGFEVSQDPDDSSMILDEIVSHHIKKILKQTNGKINGSDGAAQLLGINPNTLRNRMKKLGINYGRSLRQNR